MPDSNGIQEALILKLQLRCPWNKKRFPQRPPSTAWAGEPTTRPNARAPDSRCAGVMRICVHPDGLQLSSQESRELSRRVDAPERICRQFFRMLGEHIDPSACKLRNDAEKFSW